LKVLVIDDDPVALAIARGVIESLGHVALTLSGTMGASAVVLRERPDIVLLDIEMPALAGDEWLRLIRERDLLGGDHEVGFVLHSGGDPAELARSAKETGALGVIQKGGSPTEFIAAFERIVAPR
jgi:CheY-like chemotaxis protein